MLKLNKSILKVVMIMLVIIALVVPVASYATDQVQVIVPGTPTTSTTPTPVTSATPTQRPTTTPSPVATPTSKTNLPQTGIDDYTGLIVVTILLGASAIFAYSKIKKYKNI